MTTRAGTGTSAEVRELLVGAPMVVWLDDDPTGTQTTHDLPVLTAWSTADVRWAIDQHAAGFFVLTNTRSLGPDEAARRVREVVETCLSVETDLVFASRGDSTLRGHYPLETDTIAAVLAAHGRPAAATILAPAYCDAGHVTVGGVHYLRDGDALRPVAESEFARDVSFGYRASRLADWVEEKSGGRIRSAGIRELRPGAPAENLIADLPDHDAVVVVDAETDADLRHAAIAVLRAEHRGQRFVYRVGPSFVRARSGQEAAPPITDGVLHELLAGSPHGLTVVGSHVGQTGRQLDRLVVRRNDLRVLELDVSRLLAGDDSVVDGLVVETLAALDQGPAVVQTSRVLATASDEQASLDIARRVSDALSRLVHDTVAERRPGYVVAKGGITSSDIATRSLRIRRARVRGSLLPGIVSLWLPEGGPADGLPYVVFAGNVGDDDALADVVQRLEDAR